MADGEIPDRAETGTYLSLWRGEIPYRRPYTRTASQIIAETALSLGVKVCDIKGQSRCQALSVPRDEVAWTLRQEQTATGGLRFSLSQIGQHLGGRDHTTILSAVRRHEARLAQG